MMQGAVVTTTPETKEADLIGSPVKEVSASAPVASALAELTETMSKFEVRRFDDGRPSEEVRVSPTEQARARYPLDGGAALKHLVPHVAILLVCPSRHVQESADRRRARLFSLLCLIFFGVACTSLAHTLQYSDSVRVQMMYVLAVVVVTGCYAISRTQHWRAGVTVAVYSSWFFVFCMTVLAFQDMVVGDHPLVDDSTIFLYSPVWMFLAVIFMDEMGVVKAVVLNAGMLLIAPGLGGVRFSQAYEFFVYHFTCSLTMLSTTWAEQHGASRLALLHACAADRRWWRRWVARLIRPHADIPRERAAHACVAACVCVVMAAGSAGYLSFNLGEPAEAAAAAILLCAFLALHAASRSRHAARVPLPTVLFVALAPYLVMFLTWRIDYEAKLVALVGSTVAALLSGCLLSAKEEVVVVVVFCVPLLWSPVPPQISLIVLFMGDAFMSWLDLKEVRRGLRESAGEAQRASLTGGLTDGVMERGAEERLAAQGSVKNPMAPGISTATQPHSAATPGSRKRQEAALRQYARSGVALESLYMVATVLTGVLGCCALVASYFAVFGGDAAARPVAQGLPTAFVQVPGPNDDPSALGGTTLCNRTLPTIELVDGGHIVRVAWMEYRQSGAGSWLNDNASAVSFLAFSAASGVPQDGALYPLLLANRSAWSGLGSAPRLHALVADSHLVGSADSNLTVADVLWDASLYEQVMSRYAAGWQLKSAVEQAAETNNTWAMTRVARGAECVSPSSTHPSDRAYRWEARFDAEVFKNMVAGAVSCARAGDAFGEPVEWRNASEAECTLDVTMVAVAQGVPQLGNASNATVPSTAQMDVTFLAPVVTTNSFEFGLVLDGGGLASVTQPLVEIEARAAVPTMDAPGSNKAAATAVELEGNDLPSKFPYTFTFNVSNCLSQLPLKAVAQGQSGSVTCEIAPPYNQNGVSAFDVLANSSIGRVSKIRLSFGYSTYSIQSTPDVCTVQSVTVYDHTSDELLSWDQNEEPPSGLGVGIYSAGSEANAKAQATAPTRRKLVSGDSTLDCRQARRRYHWSSSEYYGAHIYMRRRRQPLYSSMLYSASVAAKPQSDSRTRLKPITDVVVTSAPCVRGKYGCTRAAPAPCPYGTFKAPGGVGDLNSYAAGDAHTIGLCVGRGTNKMPIGAIKVMSRTSVNNYAPYCGPGWYPATYGRRRYSNVPADLNKGAYKLVQAHSTAKSSTFGVGVSSSKANAASSTTRLYTHIWLCYKRSYTYPLMHIRTLRPQQKVPLSRLRQHPHPFIFTKDPIPVNHGVSSFALGVHLAWSKVNTLQAALAASLDVHSNCAGAAACQAHDPSAIDFARVYEDPFSMTANVDFRINSYKGVGANQWDGSRRPPAFVEPAAGDFLPTCTGRDGCARAPDAGRRRTRNDFRAHCDKAWGTVWDMSDSEEGFLQHVLPHPVCAMNADEERKYGANDFLYYYGVNCPYVQRKVAKEDLKGAVMAAHPRFLNFGTA
eukprot:g4490.t1